MNRQVNGPPEEEEARDGDMGVEFEIFKRLQRIEVGVLEIKETLVVQSRPLGRLEHCLKRLVGALPWLERIATDVDAKREERERQAQVRAAAKRFLSRES